MLTRRHLLGGAIALPCATSPAAALTSCIFDMQGVAINGIDPVSYFADHMPIVGSDRYRLRWRNAVWKFTSANTLAAFERNPHQYAPKYGGFCAVTMARGGVSETVPEAWALHNGRLYLARSADAISAWQSDPALYVSRADAHWSRASCG